MNRNSGTFQPYKEIYLPIFTKEGKSVLFIHIPKTGGSSLEKIFAEQGWTESLSIRGVHPKQLSHIQIPPQHFHAQILRQILRMEQFNKILTLVRDPFKRFVSAYAWQFSNNVTNLQPKAWIESIFEQYQNDQSLFFNHFRPQSDYILNNVKQQIFKLEEDGVVQAARAADLKEKRKSLFTKIQPWEKRTSLRDEIRYEFSQYKQSIFDMYDMDYEKFGYEKK